jgi:hypothetical protein
MDTWARNFKLIAYYRTFGFELAGYIKTPDECALTSIKTWVEGEP